jgi:hypothetical protein
MADDGTDRKKQIVARALIDPAYRDVLFDRPEEVFGHPLSPEDAQGLEQIKKLVPHLGGIVGSIASNVLCNGGGGGCGASVVV